MGLEQSDKIKAVFPQRAIIINGKSSGCWWPEGGRRFGDGENYNKIDKKPY